MNVEMYNSEVFFFSLFFLKGLFRLAGSSAKIRKLTVSWCSSQRYLDACHLGFPLVSLLPCIQVVKYWKLIWVWQICWCLNISVLWITSKFLWEFSVFLPGLSPAHLNLNKNFHNFWKSKIKSHCGPSFGWSIGFLFCFVFYYRKKKTFYAKFGVIK